MKAVFILALICAVAYANDEEPQAQEQQGEHSQHPHHHHHHHHGHHNHSVCQLEDGPLSHVLECVQTHIGDAVKTKLDQVREHLDCDSILCGVRKVCASNGGTLEGNRGNQTSVFTPEENAELRTAFFSCRPSDEAHAHLGDAAPSTEAPAHE